jgi:hypothetical protein
LRFWLEATGDFTTAEFFGFDEALASLTADFSFKSASTASTTSATNFVKGDTEAFGGAAGSLGDLYAGGNGICD